MPPSFDIPKVKTNPIFDIGQAWISKTTLFLISVICILIFVITRFDFTHQ